MNTAVIGHSRCILKKQRSTQRAKGPWHTVDPNDCNRNADIWCNFTSFITVTNPPSPYGEQRPKMHNASVNKFVGWLTKLCLNETYIKFRTGEYLYDVFPIHNGLQQGDALSTSR